MRLADFDYALPAELIARFPPSERRASRLLLFDPLGERLEDRQFAELPNLINANDLLVFNDTRVIKARAYGNKSSGGKVEILVERLLTECDVLAHVKASKAPRPGSMLQLGAGCQVQVADRRGSLYELRFDRPVLPYLEDHGEVPLPPYLDRAPVAADETRYQTVYAREAGAVAAPTAGLHFDERMLDELADRGIRRAFVTLHVGAGTFQNLREADVNANTLHSERVQVAQDVCEAVTATRARDGRVVAIGTTAVRALEAAAVAGALAPFRGETDLFIRPGYSFRVVDAMLTNFHLPKSSLLMLVAAFAGRQRTLDAYRHAVAGRYRFFSYGDVMLIPSRGMAQ